MRQGITTNGVFWLFYAFTIFLFSGASAEEPRRSYQTNYIDHTIIVLSSQGRTMTLKATVPDNEPRHGWIVWNVEVRDGAGRIEKLTTGYAFTIPASIAKPVKVSARAVEYVSAGFAAKLAANTIQKLDVGERGRLLGVRDVFLFGQGNFCITNSIPSIDTDEAWPEDKDFHSEIFTDHWYAAFPSKGASIVILFEGGGGRRIKARLRERDERNAGALFAARRMNEVKTSPSWSLRHFIFSAPQTRHRLEAEIIVEHPVVEFTIDAQF